MEQSTTTDTTTIDRVTNVFECSKAKANPERAGAVANTLTLDLESGKSDVSPYTFGNPPFHKSTFYSVLSIIIRNLEKIKIYSVPILGGAHSVLSGSAPASESVTLCGLKPPRYFWFVISGSLCDLIQFMIDLFIFSVVKIQDPSICWGASFFLSIIARHTSHRYLVFGDFSCGYWSSLLRMYGGYSISIIVSTVSNYAISKMTTVSHYGLWLITMLWTGIFNYYILKKLWKYNPSFGNGGSKRV